MATSGVHTFTMDVSDLCEEAYERCGLEMRSGYDARGARRSLNLLLLELSNHQVNLWKTELLEIPMIQGQKDYTLTAEVNDISNAVMQRADGSQLHMVRLSRDEYSHIPNKTSDGMPSQYWFHRLSTPVIHVFPVPNSNDYTLSCYRMEQIESVTDATETVDIPSRFVPAVVAGLAYYIALKRQPQMAPNLKMVYDEELTRAEYEDRERVSFMALPKVY